ncbi:MAG: glyoxalase superfamily protein [Anaerolineae bacterium]
MFKAVNPVLPCKDVAQAIKFYLEKLGFSLAFQDSAANPNYAGVRRDGVEIHLQWHAETEWGRTERPMLRFIVADVDTLFIEFSDKEVFHENTAVRDTAWGTREFAFYDLNQNGLTFYQDI